MNSFFVIYKWEDFKCEHGIDSSNISIELSKNKNLLELVQMVMDFIKIIQEEE